MNVLIILGHPDTKSFNHAVAQTCISQLEANVHSVFFHDLHAENFNPVSHVNSKNSEIKLDPQIQLHCDDLINSDGIIIIHPIWWGQPPAIIKGWLDRVLLPGIAYKFITNEVEKHIPKGLLKAHNAIVLNTSNSPYHKKDSPQESIWKNNIFNFCGVKEIEYRNFCLVKESDDARRNQWLKKIEDLINTTFPKQ
ncbi:NAD(P)H-dependent oxidoreductase [Mangrovibacterium lignilyticum]|uniref:NAD(P)H-dependent oxidoreductase n=1 Tax=Mangrovibacterium lignilyticum TaxID=2668052 RepID=UPI0013D2659D|nr:NAD(P)H-dependent oxidoreductase [Mangrovibacterium lignilyticum]